MPTSKLQMRVAERARDALPGFEVIENYRPDFLRYESANLELDIFIPALNVAIEIQGSQHYVFVPFFHKTQAGFIEQLRRDQFKRIVCAQNDIALFEAHNITEACEAIEEISRAAIEHKDQAARVIDINRVKRFMRIRGALRKLVKEIARTTEAVDAEGNRAKKCVLRYDLDRLYSEFQDLLDIAPESLRKSMLEKAMNGANNTPGSKEGEVAELRLRSKYVKSILGDAMSKNKMTRMRHAPGRLALFECERSSWLVWGGDRIHIVRKNGDELICDCGSFCVHSWLIRVYFNGKPVIKVDDISKIGCKPVSTLYSAEATRGK